MENEEFDGLSGYLDKYFELRINTKIETEIKSRDLTISMLRTELAELRDRVRLTNAALSDLAKSAAGRKASLNNGISIIIATKNRFNLLMIALKSCVWQTCAPSEVIIINDGNEFTEIEIVQISSVLGDLCPFLILANKYTKAAGARKTGMEAASSPILTYLDDDNLMWPTWLESVDQGFKMGDLCRNMRVDRCGESEASRTEVYLHKRK